MTERKTMLQWAKEFVGDPQSFEARGLIVRDILANEGMETNHRVLELGCGALSSGQYLVAHLDPDCYVGIEPNGLLVEVALKAIPEMKSLMVKRPKFLWRDDFDGSEYGTYQFVFGHSILSHAAGWQFPLIVANARRVLNRDGKLILSYRKGVDTDSSSFVYPGVSYFSARTIRRVARQYSFQVRFKEEYRQLMMASAPNDSHDWIVLTKQPRRWTEFVGFSEDELRLGFELEEETVAKLMERGAGYQVERSD